MSKWMMAVLLALGAHFSASYLVPLDEKAQQTFLGFLRWVWPWSYGDHGVLGTMSPPPAGFPMTGFFIAVTSAGLFIMAALAVIGWWVPFSWWRFLAGVGALLQLALMLSFLGLTKLLPIIFDLLILYLVWMRERST